MSDMMRPMIEDRAGEKKHRPFSMSFKGGILLLVCFLVGVAAAILLIYTLL